MKPEAFLEDHPRPQSWKQKAAKGLTAHSFFLGQGSNALEVAIASASDRPLVGDVRNLWKQRHGKRASPLLLIVLHNGKAALCGPVGEEPPVYDGLDAGQAERLARQALAEPDRHAATRLLTSMLPETEQELPGIRNSGMFSAHALRHDVPTLPDWAAACTQARKALDKRGKELVETLGFTIERHDQSVSFLRAGGVKRAVATFLDETETPEADSSRFNGMSPVSYALSVADRENVPYVLLTRGPQIRLYTAATDVGVGRKGRSETFVEANLALLPEDGAGYLPLVFGANALIEGGTFQSILERSRDFASDLGTRLRDRVYNEVVPHLAEALGRRASKRKRSQADLDFLYEQTLFILFRLLFVAYAEDKELLPYHRNENYRRQALKTLARELAERDSDAPFDSKATSYWSRVHQLWRAVDEGDADLGVPPYNGGLFSEDPNVSRAGAALTGLELKNAEVGPALYGMLVDVGPDGVRGPVDFRSLSVREFGTIYEGLLESNLAVAPSALTLDKDDTYIPVTRKSQQVVVAEGDVYLHDRSGARKGTGSYFTKPFAVEHLLQHALEPALDEHLARVKAHVDAGDEHKAADAFFDFRCADIAMGSGHFLVSAIDHIEARLSSFLAENPIPGVRAELERLRGAARDALKKVGRETDADDLEDSQLLRRQVARRCVYGVDRNRIAVELARLALWIHTFVPGLPLSFLDHSLVHGDSLTGIGSLEEAAELITAPVRETPQRKKAVDLWAEAVQGSAASGRAGSDVATSFFRDRIVEWLERSGTSLAKLARTVDATAKEIADAREAHAAALTAVATARDLFDLLVAARLGKAEPLLEIDDDRIAQHKDVETARSIAADLQCLHFPTSFPEVFIRERAGFDCIVGNPPWEEATVEELGFWALRFPGLKGLKAGEQRKEMAKLRRSRGDLVAEYDAAVSEASLVREVLIAGPYPGMGSGDPDLYKAFAWRFWQLACEDGGIGVVLPRSVLSAVGSAPWRARVLESGAFEDVTTLLNRKSWVFESVHEQYVVGLVSIRKGRERSGGVRFRGPYASSEDYETAVKDEPHTFSVSQFRSWSEHDSFPLLPADTSITVFERLRTHPRLDARVGGWRARPATEFHATNDKRLFVFDVSGSRSGLWPVYKGASFNLWEPDTGIYYGWAKPNEVTEVLQSRRLAQQRMSSSPLAEFSRSWALDPATLACNAPRIVFRDITNRLNARTVVVSLIPGSIVLTNKAPYLVWPEGDERDQAYLLGVLASIPLDWYARRTVERGLNFHLFNALPIPRPPRENALRRKIETNAGRLAASDDRFREWAKAVGVKIGSVKESEREELIAEMDAAVAILYGLDEDDVAHIFETFHQTWDYADRLQQVLKSFRTLGGKQ